MIRIKRTDWQRHNNVLKHSHFEGLRYTFLFSHIKVLLGLGDALSDDEQSGHPAMVHHFL